MNATMTFWSGQGAMVLRWGWHLAAMGCRRLTSDLTDSLRSRSATSLPDAAAVRALADSYRKSDPRFASELHAMVDRYEGSIDESRAAPH